jgi:hypothetical protein
LEAVVNKTLHSVLIGFLKLLKGNPSTSDKGKTVAMAAKAKKADPKKAGPKKAAAVKTAGRKAPVQPAKGAQAAKAKAKPATKGAPAKAKAKQPVAKGKGSK